MHIFAPKLPSRRHTATHWHSPLLIKASVACHVAAGVAVAAQPALWPWAVGGLVLDHAVVTAAGLWPRSSWLGSNMRCLPAASAVRAEVSLTIDDGPNPQITPQVLDMLDAAHAHATFFCIGRQAEKHPALCREIVRRGHSVQNHSFHHAHTFSLSGPRGFFREIARAQEALSQITGHKPRFFRAPAGLRNLFLAPVLAELDLQLVSWTRRGFDTQRTDPAQIFARLTRGLVAGDILLLHDDHVATTSSGQPVVLEVLPALLRRLDQAGLNPVTLNTAVADIHNSRWGETLPAAHSRSADHTSHHPKGQGA
jgi:peptidoglycan-N-acetylglucosamine deacetylase